MAAIPRVARPIPSTDAAVGPLAEQPALSGIVQNVDGALEVDRVGRGRRLDRPDVERRHRPETEAERHHRRPEDPARPGDEREQDQPREQAAVKGDRQAVEFDDLAKTPPRLQSTAAART